jgi:hypothetical protein
MVDDTVVVAHHRAGGAVDCEDGRELLDALGDPAATVIGVPAGEAVLPVQEGPADAVVRRRVVEGDQGGAISGHAGNLSQGLPDAKAELATCMLMHLSHSGGALNNGGR